MPAKKDDLAAKGDTRILQVSLEGLNLSDSQIARLEDTMRTAVLTELARLDLAGGITLRPIGKGTIRDGHIINGIIINDLRHALDRLNIKDLPIRR